MKCDTASNDPPVHLDSEISTIKQKKIHMLTHCDTIEIALMWYMVDVLFSMVFNGHLRYNLIPCYICNNYSHKRKKYTKRWSKMASDFPF